MTRTRSQKLCLLSSPNPLLNPVEVGVYPCVDAGRVLLTAKWTAERRDSDDVIHTRTFGSGDLDWTAGIWKNLRVIACDSHS